MKRRLRPQRLADEPAGLKRREVPVIDQDLGDGLGRDDEFRFRDLLAQIGNRLAIEQALLLRQIENLATDRAHVVLLLPLARFLVRPHRVELTRGPRFLSYQQLPPTNLLKNAIVAFFNARQVRSTARKMPIPSSFCHRIHAM